jgi:hypothetical protein
MPATSTIRWYRRRVWVASGLLVSCGMAMVVVLTR